jgi:hypothetical protein
LRSGPTPQADLHRARVVEGQVKGVQSRTETSGKDYSQSILSFRLERYDTNGNRVLLVPVEMRGLGFEGSVQDGDEARAHGKMRSGTFRANKVENLTTGAEVQARKVPKILMAIFFVFFFAILAFIIAIAVSGFSGDNSPPGFGSLPGPPIPALIAQVG